MANRDLQGEASGVSACASRPTESSAGTQTCALRGLSDKELLDGLAALVRRDHALTVDILLHLGEVEVRGLHHASGCSSLFTYCVERLGFPEEVAYKRVGASRLVRQFPFALELLAQGQLHLTALMLVRRHLTDQNHREWLLAVCHKTKREVELLVATRRPRPDVPSTIRRLPERSATASAVAEGGDGLIGTGAVGHDEAGGDAQVESGAVGHDEAGAVAGGDGLVGTGADGRNAASELFPVRKSAAPRVEPLSSSSYRVVFTASHRLKQKLDRAAELVSHSVGPGDLPALIERAVDQLIERESKRRFAASGQRTNSERPIVAGCHTDPGRQDPDLAWAEQTYGPRGEPARQDPDLVGPDRAERSHMDVVRSDQQTPTVRARSERGAGMNRVRSEPVACTDRVRPEQRTWRRRKFRWPVAATSRYVPAEVRRRIWERDGGQCAFVDTEGNRCQERQFLQIEHRNPHARGGASTVDNCCLLCAGHNRYRAKQEFGEVRICAARARSLKM